MSASGRAHCCSSELFVLAVVPAPRIQAGTVHHLCMASNKMAQRKSTPNALCAPGRSLSLEPISPIYEISLAFSA